jgi:hypothetical protein
MIVNYDRHLFIAQATGKYFIRKKKIWKSYSKKYFWERLLGS